MTSTAQPTNQSRSAGSISAPGRSGQTGTSPVTVVSGQPSYAAATQKGASPNVSQPNTANMANGGPAAVQLNPSESTNGKSAITPAVPTIINGNEHRRSPSVAVAGANGAPSAGLSKNIQFGQVNAGGSPAAAPPAGLSNPSPNSLGVTAPMNPRNTSPQTSPSPIPQPAAVSGGRPPSGLQGPGNGVNFGNLNDSNGQGRGGPQNSLGAAAPQHLRRESSQSSHSDMGNPNMPGGRGGFAPMGRGRGSFQGAYPNSGSFQSNHQHRPSPNTRGSSSMSPYFPRQQQGYPSSPSLTTRSPHLNPATPQQMNMANPGMQPSQYPHIPPHLAQQVNRTSHYHPLPPPRGGKRGRGRGTHLPKNEPLHLHNAPHTLLPQISLTPDLSPESGNFDRLKLMLTDKPPQNFPVPYDQNQVYYQNGGYMPQMGGYMPQPQPQSPRQPFGMHQAPQQSPYMQNQFNHQGPPQQPQPMSRSSSQLSAVDRPNSSMGQPQTPSIASATQAGSRNTHSPAPKAPSNFTLPVKKSSAILIKDPNSGAVKTFDKTPASPARATPPAKTSTPPIPTPPSRPVSQAETPASSGEPVIAKSDDQKKAEMRDAVARKLAEDAAASKKEAEAKAVKEKEEAERQARQAAEEAARLKAEAEAKAKKNEEEAKAKEAEEIKAKEAKEADAAKAKEESSAQKTTPSEPAGKDSKEDEIDFDAIEREIAEQEAREAAREAEYAAKKKARDEEAKRKKAEEEAAYEANMKNAEREAEALEEARMKKKAEVATEDDTTKAFASLKLGSQSPSVESPGAATPEVSGAATPVSDSSMPPPSKGPASAKRDNKPSALKLETSKAVEPPQATPAMKSLQGARKISDLSAVTYPSSIVSPNPALNTSAPADRRFKYNKEFLLQFQNVFKEKPSVDWDMRIRDTLGEGGETSGRPQSARTPSGMGPRNPSNRPSVQQSFTMGSFGAPARGGPLPPGTTSEQRFAMSNPAGRPANPFAFGRPAGAPIGGAQMSRGPSSQNLTGSIPGSPRIGGGSQRGTNRNSSRRDAKSNKKEEELAAKMPLTAGMDLKPITVSAGGWKPRSLGQGLAAGGPALGGETHLAPDVVQRKVKSNLNKMTPDNFEKISQQILDIAAQSKDETDGRTLRQVIQLTFEKATDEAHWAPMYAKFCKKMLETMSPDVKDENIKDKNGNVVAGGNLFRKYLLNRCQEEFERGWKVNLPEKPEGVTEEAAMMSEEYYIAAAAKRRGLGLVKFIGELFKLGMLTERIMHECLKKLLDWGEAPDEAEVESLTSLLKTIGAQLDLHSTLEKGPQMMEVYFARISKALEIPDLPSRLHFMLLDVIDLRKARWMSKDADKGPKTIQEVREEVQRKNIEAEQERIRSQARGGPRPQMGRGDARNFSYGQMPPPDSSSSRVGTDDLRRLGNRAARNASSTGPAAMGPGGMFSSGRTGSGRRTLGPGGLRAGDESGASSRTGTPPAQKKEEPDNTSKNAFSALAGLDGESASMATSPPSTAASPSLSKAQPAGDRSKSPAKETSK